MAPVEVSISKSQTGSLLTPAISRLMVEMPGEALDPAHVAAVAVAVVEL